MKIKLITLLAFLPALLWGQGDYHSLVGTADSLYAAKEFPASLSFYEKAFQLKKDSPGDLYNGACTAALAGQSDRAFAWLGLAFENGWTNVRHLKQDADLNSLHGAARWDDIVGRMQNRVDEIEANYDKPLQAELIQIYEEDQKWRLMIDSINTNYGWESEQMKALWKIITEVDSVNLIKIKNILDERGWVGADKVGGQANQALFLVIQHADLAAQEKYLPMMREAVAQGNASGSSLALLEDRVALRQGKRQIYGSQVGRDPETGGHYVLPLDDPDNVDERRASVGLPPLSQYVARWGIVWDAEAYKMMLPEIEQKQKK